MLCFLHNSATEVSALRPSITIKIFCSAVKILRVFLRMSFTNDSVLFFFDVPIIKSNVFDENTPSVFKISCPLIADDLQFFKVVIIMRKYLASIEVLEDAQITKEGFIYIR